MRLARIVGPLVALVLAVTVLGQALVSPADAAGKPKHQISVKGGEVGHTNQFFLTGKVATLPKGKIKVLRNVAGGRYTTYKKIKTRSSGKFHVSIVEVGRKKTCFKIQVPATSVYRKTTTPVVGCITSG
jgi:hypothetical protein